MFYDIDATGNIIVPNLESGGRGDYLIQRLVNFELYTEGGQSRGKNFGLFKEYGFSSWWLMSKVSNAVAYTVKLVNTGKRPCNSISSCSGILYFPNFKAILQFRKSGIWVAKRSLKRMRVWNRVIMIPLIEISYIPRVTLSIVIGLLPFATEQISWGETINYSYSFRPIANWKTNLEKNGFMFVDGVKCDSSSGECY